MEDEGGNEGRGKAMAVHASLLFFGRKHTQRLNKKIMQEAESTKKNTYVKGRVP